MLFDFHFNFIFTLMCNFLLDEYNFLILILIIGEYNALVLYKSQTFYIG